MIPLTRTQKIILGLVGAVVGVLTVWYGLQLVHPRAVPATLHLPTPADPLVNFRRITGVHLLLTMPLAASVVVIARMVVGVKTFGLFTPMLMAMAFLQTGPIAGPLLLAGAIAAGLLAAPALKALKMARVGFLAGLMGAVVLALVSVMPALEDPDWVTAFPVIVTALAVERWWVVWEAEGNWEALKVALGTLAVAFTIEMLVLAPFTFWMVEQSRFLPALIGGAIGIAGGMYQGLRLSELARFRVVLENDRERARNERAKRDYYSEESEEVDSLGERQVQDEVRARREGRASSWNDRADLQPLGPERNAVGHPSGSVGAQTERWAAGGRNPAGSRT